MPAAVIGNILGQNAKIASYTGKQPPYGNLDWWPVSLWMNTQVAPYSDVRVRRAISLAIDRDKLDELLYVGAKVTTIYPFPLYPGLQRSLTAQRSRRWRRRISRAGSIWT